MKPPEAAVLLLADLDGDPAQVRSDAVAHEGMVKSLEAGQLQPILVYRKGSRYVVLDGHRRVAALAQAGRDRVHAVVVPAPDEPGKRILLQLIANLQREDLSPMDRARAFRAHMKETGCTAAELSELVGLSGGTVSRTLALLELPEATQQRIESGELTASDGYRLHQSEQAERASRRRAVDGSVAVAAKSEKAKPARAIAVLGGGRQIAFGAPTTLTLELVVEMLEELLAKARRFRNRGVALDTMVQQLRLDAKAGRSAAEAQS